MLPSDLHCHLARCCALQAHRQCSIIVALPQKSVQLQAQSIDICVVTAALPLPMSGTTPT